MTTSQDELIEPQTLYSIASAKSRLGVGAWAWRTFLKAGLKTTKLGRRRYVRGQAIIDVIAKIDGDQNAQDAQLNSTNPLGLRD